jgi:hypothetical protein
MSLIAQTVLAGLAMICLGILVGLVLEWVSMGIRAWRKRHGR